MVSRRALLAKIATGVGLVFVPSVAWRSSAIGGAEAQRKTTADNGAIACGGEPRAGAGIAQPPPPWPLLEPLVAGSAIGHGWRVVDLTGVTDGSSVLTMRNETGREQRIRICRNDGRPEGVVYTERFDLLVINGGKGDLPTNERIAQAVARVAHVIAANEKTENGGSAMGLLPHCEWLRLSSASGHRNWR